MHTTPQIIIGYLNETREDFEKTVEFVKEYHDCRSEILLSSLLHTTLKDKWIKEGEPLIMFKNNGYI